MHRKALVHIVDKRFTSLSANWNGIREANKDAVHDWRVDYKKLRAIVRLARMEAKKLEIPLSLKDVYALAGQIRDRHIQFERMKEWFGSEEVFPPVYSQLLNDEIAMHVDQLRPLTENDVILRIAEHKIKSSLPAHIPKKTIHSYIQNQLFEVRNILWLTYKKDDYLHSCRKHLKDVQYIVEAIGFHHFRKSQVKGLPSPTQLQAAAQQLGDFNDQCVTAKYLSSSYLNRLPGDEKIILSSLKTKMQREKTKSRNKLISSLELLMKELI